MSERPVEAGAVNCPVCKSASPEGKRYCGDCGAFLDSTLGPVKDYLDANVRAQVAAVLREQYKDQKLLESEIAEGVATKLSGWAKLLGFFIGIPLGILVITLGAIGIKNYLDFMSLVAGAKRETEERVEVARKEGEAITTQYQTLKDQLAEATGLANDVKVLSAKVNQISERIGFVPTAALTPELKSQLESSLGQFQRYMQQLGYKGTEGGVRIAVNPREDREGPAYYLDGTIKVEAPFATDIDILFREYSHHVLISSAGGKLSPELEGLESGLASYLSCSFNGDPAFGENSLAAFGRRYKLNTSDEFMAKGSIHNLKNDRKFADLEQHPDDTSYVPAEVWGGAFWDLRERLGQGYTDRLLFQTWRSLRGGEAKGDLPKYFYERLAAANNASGEGDRLEQIREVFRRRGLSL